MDYPKIIEPDEVITWMNTNRNEEILSSSWANDMESKVCARICDQLFRIAHDKSIFAVTRYQGQRVCLKNYLQQIGRRDIHVTTTTGALGTHADIVVVSG